MTHHLILCNNTDHACTLEVLTNVVTGAWEPTPLEIEYLLEHLITCVPCQVILGICVILYGEGESAIKQTQSTIDAFHAVLEETIHGTDFQNKLTTYIELLEAQGEEQACKRFPGVANHLEKCAVCRAVVEDTLYLLQEMQEEASEPTNSRTLQSSAKHTPLDVSPDYFLR